MWKGLILALALTVPAMAEDLDSANSVMPGCRDYLRNVLPPNNKAAYDVGVCEGIVEGLIYLDRAQCPPNGVIHTQTIRVVVAYIDARPARMHENFKRLVLEALRAAWPCK
jgi:hypothetical protein